MQIYSHHAFDESEQNVYISGLERSNDILLKIYQNIDSYLNDKSAKDLQNLLKTTVAVNKNGDFNGLTPSPIIKKIARNQTYENLKPYE